MCPSNRCLFYSYAIIVIIGIVGHTSKIKGCNVAKCKHVIKYCWKFYWIMTEWICFWMYNKEYFEHSCAAFMLCSLKTNIKLLCTYVYSVWNANKNLWKSEKCIHLWKTIFPQYAYFEIRKKKLKYDKLLHKLRSDMGSK